MTTMEPARGATATVAPPAGVFVRKASGLVRQASGRDAFMFNVYFINIGIGVAFLFLNYAAYHGANLIFATLATLVLCLPTSLLYVMFMAAMPRSGGDYLYVTRSLGPALGFMSNWNWNMWNFYLMGVAGSFLGLYGISATFRVIAGFTHNASIASAANWATTPTGKFLISAFLVIGLISMFTFGRNLRAYIKFQKVTFYLATLGTIVAILAVLFITHAGFVHNFNDYMRTFTTKPSPYHTVLVQGNFHPAPFNLGQSMLAVTFAYVVLGFGMASTYIGGEIKQTSRVWLKSLTGSLVYSAIFMVVILAVFIAVIGNRFIGSLDLAPSGSIGLSFTPTFAELGAIASGNIVFGLIIVIGFALWTYVWLPGYIVSWSRSMLAWSMDRLVPAKLGEVDQKRQAPVYGLLVLLVLSLAACALYSYTHLLTLLAGALGETLTFVMVSIAGILFPFRQPEIFESSQYHKRWRGIPLMTVLGVLSLFCTVGVCLIFCLDPNSGVKPSQHLANFIFTFATFASGLVVYYVIKIVRARQGVDVTLAHNLIPPE